MPNRLSTTQGLLRKGSVNTVDPNETLRRMLKLSANVIENVDNDIPIDLYVTSELAEACQALHEWMKKGGFLPNEWERAK